MILCRGKEESSMEKEYDNILVSIKKLSGVSSFEDVFDPDLLMFLNSNMLILSQLGITEASDITITPATMWTDILPEGDLLNIVKCWMYLRVRMQFDPPTGSIASSFEELIKEYEWRINSRSDYES